MARRGEKARLALALALGPFPRRLKQAFVEKGSAHHVFIDIGAEAAHGSEGRQEKTGGEHLVAGCTQSILDGQVAEHDNPGADYRMVHRQADKKETGQQNQIEAVVGDGNGQGHQPTGRDDEHNHHPRNHIAQRSHRERSPGQHLPWPARVAQERNHYHQHHRPHGHGIAMKQLRQICQVDPHEQEHESNGGKPDQPRATGHFHMQIIKKSRLQLLTETQVGKSPLLRHDGGLVNLGHRVADCAFLHLPPSTLR